MDKEIDIAGPELAHQLASLGLVDEYRIYVHPIILGGGKAFFAGPQRPLRVAGNNRIGKETVQLIYAAA